VERAVGAFVLFATLLLLVGFGYYLYHTSQSKGWFVTKVKYSTSLYSAAGLKVGDPVKLMGRDVGAITVIDTQPPDELFSIYVEFEVREPYYGYLWTAGSKVKVSPAGLLDQRTVEVTKGTNYIPTYLTWPIREMTPAAAAALPGQRDQLFLDAISVPVVTREVLRPACAPEDLADIPGMVGQLREKTNAVGGYVLSRLGEETRRRVVQFKGTTAETRALREALAGDLDRLVEGESLYDAGRFAGVTLSEETRGLTGQTASGESLRRLNRLLLEQAFPQQLARTRRVTAPMMPLDAGLCARMTDAGVAKVRVADRSSTSKRISVVWDLKAGRFEPYTATTKAYWLPPEESPALTERLNELVLQVEEALPSVLALTNQLAQLLTRSADAAGGAEALLAEARPMLANLGVVTSHLTNADGSLGRWLLPGDMYGQALVTLTNANGALTNVSATLGSAGTMLTAANTNMTRLVAELTPSLQNLSIIISNLNTQVQGNTNFMATLHRLLLDTDDLIEGFKRHWLLRSAFKPKVTNRPPAKSTAPMRIYRSPKGELYAPRGTVRRGDAETPRP
jgi:ABC-type transporter Mla subunit MlaD